MRISCPHCGERGNEEFLYRGAADPVRPDADTPGADAPGEAWHAYVYLRDNPAGAHRELWQHAHGCRRWLVVTRDTGTHEIFAVADAATRDRAP